MLVLQPAATVEDTVCGEDVRIGRTNLDLDLDWECCVLCSVFSICWYKWMFFGLTCVFLVSIVIRCAVLEHFLVVNPLYAQRCT